nr:proton-conducting transporter membrane subunit [Thiorhodovibrio winogradskyi]
MLPQAAGGSHAPELAMLVLPMLAALGVRPVAAISLRAARLIGPVVLAACIGLGLALLFRPDAAPELIRLGAAGAPLGLILRVDGLALVLALAGTVLVLLSWTRGEDHPDPARQDTAMLLLAGGLTGLAFAGDLLTSWLFLELSAMSAAVLLLFGGTLRSLTAVVGFLRWGALGSAIAVFGLGLAMVSVDSLAPGELQAAADAGWGMASRLGYGLVVLGFGVKIGLFPLNAWVAGAARAAQPRLLAVMTGALPALALASLARLLWLGDMPRPDADVLMALGMLSVLAGAFGMWRALEFPAFLVSLSLAAIGSMAIGFSLPGPAGVFSALALLLHFLLIHSALFVLAHRWRGRIADLAGIGWRLPLTSAVLLLLAASMVGVPPLPGFWAKLMLVLSLAEQEGSLVMVALFAVLLAAAVEAAAWLRLIRELYVRPQDELASTEQPNSAGQAPPLRADLLPRLLVPGRLARAYLLLVASLLLIVTLAVVPVAEHLNQLVIPRPQRPLAAGPQLAALDQRATPAKGAVGVRDCVSPEAIA